MIGGRASLSRVTGSLLVCICRVDLYCHNLNARIFDFTAGLTSLKTRVVKVSSQHFEPCIQEQSSSFVQWEASDNHMCGTQGSIWRHASGNLSCDARMHPPMTTCDSMLQNRHILVHH